MPTVFPTRTPKGLEYLQQAYFAGPKAKTAADAPADRIFMDPSGMPRFEQPDNEARLLGIENITDYYAKLRRPGPRMEGDPASDLRATTVPLSEILQHDLLFQDYPELKDMPVMLLPSQSFYNASIAGYGPHQSILEALVDRGYAGPFEGPFLEDPALGKTQAFPSEINEMRKKVSLSPTGAMYLTPHGSVPDKPYRDFGPMPTGFEDNFQKTMLGAILHETGHGIDTFEGTDKYGAYPTDFRDSPELQRYFARPTEMTSFLAQSRINMPEDERYKDMPAMAKLFENNAAWKDEGIAGQYIEDILAESGIYPDDPNYRSAYAAVMKDLMDNAIAEESMVP